MAKTSELPFTCFRRCGVSFRRRAFKTPALSYIITSPLKIANGRRLIAQTYRQTCPLHSMIKIADLLSMVRGNIGLSSRFSCLWHHNQLINSSLNIAIYCWMGYLRVIFDESTASLSKYCGNKYILLSLKNWLKLIKDMKLHLKICFSFFNEIFFFKFNISDLGPKLLIGSVVFRIDNNLPGFTPFENKPVISRAACVRFR